MTRRLVVTGARGRVGALLRAAWDLGDGAGPPPLWLSRGAPGAAGLRHGGEAARWDGRTLPPAAAGGVLLALGGVPGPEGGNAGIALAHRAAAEAAGTARMLAASSLAVYGAAEGAGEEAPLAPLGAYGADKAAMEAALAGSGAPPVTVLRLANVVGADSLAPALAGGGATLDRMGGAGPVRSWIGAAALLDAVRALAAMEAPPAVLNLGQDPPLAMEALLRAAGCAVRWRDGAAAAAPVATMDLSRLMGTPAATPPADAGRLVAALAAQRLWLLQTEEV